ncbi:F0F1 ATP synthase subunit gamma [Microaerobacter geothermalis]|uniref:ATP synthase F1 subunit gamma n=1 Tax=Microaerobacter geothermalis TaxID=674972 RepID=UPI001F30FB2B|nr:ATP synthase F1 subunit gamma [Microaerobacter geothermalis]MCF6093225.1 F0F1 ATP synthase subunit gamma [Microaerobacter geothermalis]
MQGTREIKRRIKSVQNTRQITKAMEMVAAAKLRRSQERAEQSRPYAEKMREVIASIAAGSKGMKHPMLISREVKKTGYLVITSDRGLAGGFNGNILRKVVSTIRERHKSQDEYAIFVVGRKGRDFFKRRNYPLIGEVIGLSDYPTYADISQLASKAVGMYADGTFDELYLVYNKFVSAIQQVPTEQKLLPLEQVSVEEKTLSYEYEPSSEEVLAELLPKYAETLIFSALLDSKASEQGARMTAMGSATDNATEMISKYTLMYNRARQASITQEISEIVGGANALS